MTRKIPELFTRSFASANQCGHPGVSLSELSNTNQVFSWSGEEGNLHFAVTRLLSAIALMDIEACMVAIRPGYYK